MIDGERLLEFVVFKIEQWRAPAVPGSRRSTLVDDALTPEQLTTVRLFDQVERRGGENALMQVGVHLYTLLHPGTSESDFKRFLDARRTRGSSDGVV